MQKRSGFEVQMPACVAKDCPNCEIRICAEFFRGIGANGVKIGNAIDAVLNAGDCPDGTAVVPRRNGPNRWEQTVCQNSSVQNGDFREGLEERLSAEKGADER